MLRVGEVEPARAEVWHDGGRSDDRTGVDRRRPVRRLVRGLVRRSVRALRKERRRGDRGADSDDHDGRGGQHRKQPTVRATVRVEADDDGATGADVRDQPLGEGWIGPCRSRHLVQRALHDRVEFVGRGSVAHDRLPSAAVGTAK